MNQSRRFWTPEEDQALIAILDNMETINWTLAAVQLFNVHPDSNRNSKQCRQRWIHHLNIGQKMRPWTDEEQKMMVDLFLVHHSGKNKWKAISEALSLHLTRQPTEVKNRFYALIRRGLRRINNYLGRQIKPQQIRILKPSTISALIEKIDEESSSELVKVIYEMASKPLEEEKPINDKQILSDMLNKIIGFASEKKEAKENESSENKENIKLNTKQFSKRKYSVETSSNEFNVKEDLKSSMRTMTSAQEMNHYEEDIGCFLNIQQVQSPVLEFEDFLPF